jgi:hypothetical protein
VAKRWAGGAVAPKQSSSFGDRRPFHAPKLSPSCLPSLYAN